jgi:Ca-activated chloride channel family protein
MIRLLYPSVLCLLAVLPLWALLRSRAGRVAALRYSSVALALPLGSATRHRSGRFLTTLRFLTAGLLIVALARPQFGRSSTEVKASGVDLVLALDVSGSMESLDFQLDNEPASRLQVVKSVVAPFIKDRPSDRIALVAFAGRPYLISPLTLDHDFLLQNLDRLKIGLVEDGTAIGSAIASSVNRLRRKPSRSQVIILLTDGMNNVGKVQPKMAAEAAAALGIKIYTIAVGSTGQAPLPVRDRLGNTHLVMTQVDVDEATLKDIAETTGGRFFRATDTDSLKKIYAEIDAMEKTTHTIKRYEHFQECFAALALAALLLLGLELTLRFTRFRRIP